MESLSYLCKVTKKKKIMSWYKKYLSVYEKPYNEVPLSVIETVRKNIGRMQSDKPIATVSVIAYNEEKHLLACLWSLSEMQCRYPIEIIGVDNDSKDHTADIFKAVNIPFYTEKRHSCGYARQCGLNHSRGKYHINIDSDTMYPPRYVETMIGCLEKKGVVGACSAWSYIPDAQHSWISLKCYETARDLYLWLQHFKRPELSVRGLVFAYDTTLGKKIGIRTDIIRGEDGSLALELKQYGKIKFIHNRKARAITGYGTVGTDGSFLNSFRIRAIKAFKNIGSLFTHKEHYEDKEDNIIKE